MNTSAPQQSQKKKNGKNGHSVVTPPVDDTPDRAYARGFRECYGMLTVVVNELTTEARIKHLDKLQELYLKMREAEKRAGEGL